MGQSKHGCFQCFKNNILNLPQFFKKKNFKLNYESHNVLKLKQELKAMSTKKNKNKIK